MELKKYFLNKRLQFYPDTSFFYFIQDYKQHIKNNSEIVRLFPEDKVQYNYRIKNLLRDKGYDNSVYWIVLMINEINSFDSILNKEYLFLPNINILNELKLKYKNLKAKKNTSAIRLKKLKTK